MTCFKGSEISFNSFRMGARMHSGATGSRSRHRVACQVMYSMCVYYTECVTYQYCVGPAS
jgi:hypothetical protein